MRVEKFSRFCLEVSVPSVKITNILRSITSRLAIDFFSSSSPDSFETRKPMNYGETSSRLSVPHLTSFLILCGSSTMSSRVVPSLSISRLCRFRGFGLRGGFSRDDGPAVHPSSNIFEFSRSFSNLNSGGKRTLLLVACVCEVNELFFGRRGAPSHTRIVPWKRRRRKKTTERGVGDEGERYLREGRWTLFRRVVFEHGTREAVERDGNF